MSEVLTTDGVDPTDRLDYWREVICAAYVELDAEPVSAQAFVGSVTLASWGDTRISNVRSRGQVVTRRPSAEKDDCLISLQIQGAGRITQGGRTALLEPGDFALYDATRPYQLAFDDTFEQLVVQFPRQALIDRNLHVESAVARTCSGREGFGAVAASFVRTLADHDAEIPDDHRHRLGDQAVDFSASALAMIAGSLPTRDAARRFDRQRVLRFVDQHLEDPALSVGHVARSFGVSARTIQKLFADDPKQLGARIRDARIDRAKQALVDQRRSHLTIARIATDLGFGSAGNFARAFKATSGCTPREYRDAYSPNGSAQQAAD